MAVASHEKELEQKGESSIEIMNLYLGFAENI